MIDIGGTFLDERHRWINDTYDEWPDATVQKDVIVLVSTQNVSKHWEAWQRMIKALRPLPAKVVFCENDSDDNTLSLLKEWDFPHEILTFTSKPDALEQSIYDPIAKNRQKLLTRAREINPAYAMYLDDDMFPEQPNIIQALTEHKKDIMSGVYLRPYDNDGIFLNAMWHPDQDKEDFPESPDIEKYIKQAKENGEEYLMFTACLPHVYKVGVVGAGCMCLSNKILQDKRLKFYPLEQKTEDPREQISEDFLFCLHAKEKGYEIYIDGAIPFTHLAPTPDRRRPWAL